MANVYLEARFNIRPDKPPVQRYVVKDFADQVLGIFRNQKEAIHWARAMGHSPLLARFGDQNDKNNPAHWQPA
ncbi:MAG TPA: hypothetical protein VJS11_09065 [Acidobacteriaceae bacterium]|nr:hypothetical protein [Acidobacteriaceae bacterium]